MLEQYRVTLIIPAYNEADGIGKTLSELEKLTGLDEILVVDDGSTDQTAAIVQQHPCATLLQHPYNIGNGAAIKTGLRQATGEVIILMDGDGQHPPSEIPNLLAHIEYYDMVVGKRSKGTEAHWHRNLANTIFNRYASYVAGNRVEDLTSGFRVLRAEVARQFTPILPNTYSSPSTLTIACFKSGYTVKYHPFQSPRRTSGSSGIKIFRDGFRFLLTITRMGVLFSPMRIFLPISFVMIAVSLTYVLGELVFNSRFSGFGGLILTLGIFTFLLGLVSEQIALLRIMKK